MLAAALAAVPARAAEVTFVPYVQSNMLYDSNVFRVDSNANVPVLDGKQVRDDFIFSNYIGANATYQYGLQGFHVKAEGRRYDYLELSRFNHYEYTLGGGLDYQLLSRVSGALDYEESRRQSVFADRNVGQIATQLNFDRDRLATATAKFLASNDWAVDTSYKFHSLTTPVVGAPTLKLNEHTGTAGLNYVGISRFTLGLLGSYGAGQYSGTPAATSYTQYGGAGVLSYDASDISKFSVSGGYSSRNDAGIGTNGGFTGELNYYREITAKTRTQFRGFRRLASYAAGDNTVIETGIGNETWWVATEKVSVELTYDYLHTAFQNQGLAGTFDRGRKDSVYTAGFRLIYAPLRWLDVSTTTFYAIRKSNVQVNEYNDATILLKLVATLK